MKGISAGGSGKVREFSGTMTDISFLLIVFFLITAAFVTDRGLFMTLPDPDSGPKELSADEVVVIGVGASGYSVDGVRASDAALSAVLSSAIGAKQPEAVILDVEPGVLYERVLATLEAAKAAGAQTFSITAGKDPVPVDLQDATR